MPALSDRGNAPSMTPQRARYLAWAASSTTADTLPHGTGRYVALRCRCAICKQARADWGRTYRTAKALMGLCVNCTRDAVPGRSKCPVCAGRGRKASR